MEALTAIIRTLAALLLLTAVLELLIPQGTLSRFVRLVMGLAVLALLLSPLLQWLEQSRLPGVAPSALQEDYAAQGEELGQLLQELALEQWEEETESENSGQ